MPHLINGFGTWYIGKQNVHNCKDVCPECNTITNLSSYDTNSYLMALYIPLIPIGKKRVLMECPHCKKFRVGKLAEWEKAKAAAYEAARDTVQNRMGDQKAVEEALGSLIGTQNAVAFDEIAPKVLERWRQSAYMLQQLGDAYAYFDRSLEAIEIYHAALELTDSEETRGALARELIIASRPDEALALIEYMFDSPQDEQQALVQILVHAYQAEGRHEEAVRVLDRAIAAYPANAGIWNDMKQQSQKRLAKGTPIRQGYFDNQAREVKESRARWRFALAPVLLVIALIVYLNAAIDKGKSRDIFAVNGLSTKYTITINGNTHTLHPGRYAALQLPEGSYTVQTSLPVPDQNVTIQSNFFLRPFDDKTFVINPDRCALLLWEKTEYTDTPDPNAEYGYAFYAGRLLYEFSRIHYFFSEFPDQVMAEGDVTKKRIAMMSDYDLGDTLSVLHDEETGTDIPAYLLRRYHCEPDAYEVISALQLQLEPGVFLEEMKEALVRRPVLMETHRMYQSLCEAHYPEKDLVAEYTALLEAEPDNDDLQYLHSRVNGNPQEVMAQYAQLASGESPHPYATNALAYYFVSQGRFQEALALSEKAMAAAPDKSIFSWAWYEAAAALEEYELLLQDLDRDNRGIPVDYNTLYSSAYYRYCRGDQKSEITKEVGEFCRREERTSEMDEETVALIMSAITELGVYATGDFDGFIAIRMEDNDAMAPLWKAMYAMDCTEADRLLEEAQLEGLDGLEEHILIYAMAGQQGNTALAEKHFNTVVALLPESYENEFRQVGQWLAGEQPFDADAAHLVPIEPDQKRTLLLALGMRYPEHRQQCFALARRLNYNRLFPHFILNKLLDVPVEAQVPEMEAGTVSE